jgi:hypothetical protein
MFQHITPIRPIHTETLRWLSLLAVMMVLLSAGSAHADGIEVTEDGRLFFIDAVTEIAFDGDGRLDAFEAKATVYDDGTARGTIYLDTDLKIALHSGYLVESKAEETAVVSGTQYQYDSNGRLISPTEVEVFIIGPKLNGAPLTVEVPTAYLSFEASGEWIRY